MSDGLFTKDVTRRDAMKTAMKAGAYAAPVIIATSVSGIGVAAATPPPGTPTVTVTPAAGTPGQVFTISLTGFRPNVAISVAITNSSGTVIRTLTANTNAAGAATVTFDSSGVPLGTFNVTATDGTTQAMASLTVSPPTCAAGATSLAFPQDALLLNVAPGASFDVFAQPNTAATATRIGSFTADALGVAVATFAVPPPAIALNTTSVTLSVFLAGSTTASATFVSGLVGLIACTAGGPRQAAKLTSKVIQEATGCPNGNPNQWREIVDANLVNADPSAPYDIYFRPNNVVGGAFALAGTITTNAQGNAGAILTAPVIATTGGNPTSVVVTAVPGGSAAPTAASALAATATPTGNPVTSSLFTVTCAGAVTSSLSLAAANKTILLTGV